MSKEQRKEYNKLEKDIAKLDKQIQELEGKINDPANATQGYSTLGEWAKSVLDMRVQLEAKEEKWMALAALAE